MGYREDRGYYSFVQNVVSRREKLLTDVNTLRFSTLPFAAFAVESSQFLEVTPEMSFTFFLGVSTTALFFTAEFEG